MVEGPGESDPMGAESADPLGKQEAKPSMEVNVSDIPPLTSDAATTVMAEEDKMLMGSPASVAGEMARLQVSSPDSHKPKDGETQQ